MEPWPRVFGDARREREQTAQEGVARVRGEDESEGLREKEREDEEKSEVQWLARGLGNDRGRRRDGTPRGAKRHRSRNPSPHRTPIREEPQDDADDGRSDENLEEKEEDTSKRQLGGSARRFTQRNYWTERGRTPIGRMSRGHTSRRVLLDRRDRQEAHHEEAIISRRRMN